MTATAELLSMRPKSLWRFFVAQGFVYWAMCCYLFIEYVRPQQLIGALNTVPVGQIVLGAALLAHVGSGRWFSLNGKGSWYLLLFTTVIVASSLTAYSPGASFDEWRLWFSWVVIYFLIISVVRTEQRLMIFTLVWLLCHYYMSQGGAKQWAFRGFSFADYGIVGAPGWFQNSGEFGAAMDMFFVVSLRFYVAARPYATKWWKVFLLGMPVTAAMSVLGSSSRGAVLGLAAVGAWSLLHGRRRIRMAIGVVVLAVVAWVVLPEAFKARFRSAGTDDTSLQRLVYWKNGRDMAMTHPVLGVGYANWLTYYGSHYADARAGGMEARVQLSHNIFIQCMAELGFTGLAAFVLLIVATLRLNYQTRKLASAARAPPRSFMIQLAYGLDAAMVTYLVNGYFVTILYYPFFWINFAFTVALSAVARRTYRGHAVLAGGPSAPIGGGQVSLRSVRPR